LGALSGSICESTGSQEPVPIELIVSHPQLAGKFICQTMSEVFVFPIAEIFDGVGYELEV
jgi:hypothetical protein